MAGERAWIQMYRGDRWTGVATIEPLDAELGHQGGSLLEYDPAYYAFGLDMQDTPWDRVSVRYPVSLEFYREETWPPFLLDLLPQGAGRRYHLFELGIEDGPTSDWPLLCHGARYPVGNLRVVPERDWVPQTVAPHPGFPIADILEKKEDFIAYARENGAPIGGSTDVQGDAPKFLVCESVHGRFHVDAALRETEVKKHWLVKFPRGKKERDRLVLANEAAYSCVADRLGLTVAEVPRYEAGVLFVPRFDRVVTPEGITRLGLESLASAAGVARFGAYLDQADLCAVIFQHCTEDPAGAVIEFILRDALAMAMGDTDNHARNTALLKSPGAIQLAPLFDFAPMYLDEAGIARTCLWRGAEEGGRVKWAEVCARMGDLVRDPERVRAEMLFFGERLERLEEIMRQCGVSEEIIDGRRLHRAEITEALRSLPEVQGVQS